MASDYFQGEKGEISREDDLKNRTGLVILRASFHILNLALRSIRANTTGSGGCSYPASHNLGSWGEKEDRSWKKHESGS